MTKEELKPQVEEMLYQLLKLVGQLDDKESYELKIELACSIITLAIDFDFDNNAQTLANLVTAIDEVKTISMNGTIRVLGGNGVYKEL